MIISVSSLARSKLIRILLPFPEADGLQDRALADGLAKTFAIKFRALQTGSALDQRGRLVRLKEIASEATRLGERIFSLLQDCDLRRITMLEEFISQ